MSADNYIYIRLRPDGKIGVSHRFASDDYDENGPPEDRFVEVSYIGAAMAAQKWMDELAVCEYGIMIEPKLGEIVRAARDNAAEQCL